MVAFLLIIFWLFRKVTAQLARLIARRRRNAQARRASGGRRDDSGPHSRPSEAEAEVEDHDLDDVLDAIAELRRRTVVAISARNSATSSSEDLGGLNRAS
jgi:hypothetical protein